MEAIVESFRLLTDEQLLAEVHVLVERECTATTVLIASLAEVDARQLYLAQGYSSLIAYCIGALHLSEGAAYRRMTAARVARTFPVALDLLADRSLSLTSLSILAPHLTAANHMELFDAARHRTRREVEQQIAALNPGTPELITIHLRVRRETHDKLRRAQDLLRHVIANGDVAEIFDRALTLLVADVEKTKLGNVTRPRRPRKAALGSRHVPAAVRRAVWRRDGGRCGFVGVDGRCCNTGFLEFHHVVPFARGGLATVENIQLRCRAHNQYEGKQEFGPQTCIVRERQPAYGRPSIQRGTEDRPPPATDRAGRGTRGADFAEGG
jgi:5-methylcytosine-specific restriction endonuclease McrA